MPTPLIPPSAVQTIGNPDLFKVLASSVSDGWLKSTKAMVVAGGCLVQVTTQMRNPDGSYVVSEALAFVPGVRIEPDTNNGKKLIAER